MQHGHDTFDQDIQKSFLPSEGGAGMKIRKYYPKPSFLNEYSTHSFSCPMQPAWQRNSQQPLTWLCPLSPWEFVCTVSHFSHVWLCATLWMVTCQAPLSVGFSRQEYWSGLPCPPPRDLTDPGIKPVSLMSPALAGRFQDPLEKGMATHSSILA